jgi:hypothetical protein
MTSPSASMTRRRRAGNVCLEYSLPALIAILIPTVVRHYNYDSASNAVESVLGSKLSSSSVVGSERFYSEMMDSIISSLSDDDHDSQGVRNSVVWLYDQLCSAVEAYAGKSDEVVDDTATTSSSPSSQSSSSSSSSTYL